MQNLVEPIVTSIKRCPWNKGKLIGPKPPLQPRHVWAIRTRLQLARRIRDLALFNLAIDSKLRGCDVVSLKVEDVAPHGYAKDRATVRQRKTGRPVKFEITEQTRQAIDDHLRATGKKPDDFLFTGRRGRDRCLTTRQYARLLTCGRTAPLPRSPALGGQADENQKSGLRPQRSLLSGVKRV